MSDLNNILKKYAVGESLGIKVKEPKKIKSFAEDFNMIINYKEKTISMENMNLTRSINDIIDYKTGKKSLAPSAEALVPMKVVKTLDAAQLIKKGYKIKGVSDEEMKQIVQEDDTKSIWKKFMKLVTHYDFDQEAFNRMDGTIFRDAEGNLKIEYIQNPQTFTSKLINLYAHNNEIITFYYFVMNLLFAINIGILAISIVNIPIAILSVLLRKVLARPLQVLDIWFTSTVFGSLRNIEKRYIDSASTLALSKYFMEVLEDLEEQAKSKGMYKDVTAFSQAKNILSSYINKEEVNLNRMKNKLLAQRGVIIPTK